jgi:hypothetical protein
MSRVTPVLAELDDGESHEFISRQLALVDSEKFLPTEYELG